MTRSAATMTAPSAPSGFRRANRAQAMSAWAPANDRARSIPGFAPDLPSGNSTRVLTRAIVRPRAVVFRRETESAGGRRALHGRVERARVGKTSAVAAARAGEDGSAISSVANPGVEHRVERVDPEVDEHDDRD